VAPGASALIHPLSLRVCLPFERLAPGHGNAHAWRGLGQRMNAFAPWSALGGGALIGLSASLLLLTHGRVAGVSGIVGGLLPPRARDRAYRAAFLLGLLAAGGLIASWLPGAIPPRSQIPTRWIVLAGLLVGYGTRLGSGCTSGHGVCGVSRLAPRSIAATLTFMTTGAATVFVVRHVIGGLR
jgi:uncharacterized protein